MNTVSPQDLLNMKLYKAIGQSDLKTVCEAIDAGANVNWLCLDGELGSPGRPVRLAARKQSPEIVQRLLEAGADALATDGEGLSPIHHGVLNATTSSDLSVLAHLIDYGADIGVKSARGRTPLHFASTMNLGNVSRFLLDKGADGKGEDSDGRCPLELACAYGSLEAALVLIAYGASSAGLTASIEPLGRALQMNALQAAASANLGDIVLRHLDAGMDPNESGAVGKSAIGLAEEYGRAEVLEIIKKYQGRKLALATIGEIDGVSGPEPIKAITRRRISS